MKEKEYIFWTRDPRELQHWTVVLKALCIPYQLDSDGEEHRVLFHLREDQKLPLEFAEILA